MFMEAFTVASTALGMMSSYNQGAASAKYQRKQAAWNDKQNLKRARSQGSALDTNIVRARTEVAATMGAIENSEKEAVAQARVAAAAGNMGAGSYDTVLNTFAKKRNQAEGNTVQMLVAELVQDKLKRNDIAIQATSSMSTGTAEAPSLLGTLALGAADYFQATYGLKGSGGFGGSDKALSPGIVDWGSSGPGISLGGADPFKGILKF